MQHIPPPARPIFYWVIYTLALLVIVTSAGFIMRLVPYALVRGLNYEYLLHAHSHLAFLGWVYNALFIGLIWTFIPNHSKILSKYNTLFWITQAVTFCMFIVFLYDGYQSPAIATLALHTVMTYMFIIYFLHDSKKNAGSLPGWMMKCALFCLFISSLGPFAIPVIKTYSMNIDHIKLAVNFYLHFQYNGWFVFGLLAIIIKCLPDKVIEEPLFRRGSVLLFIAVFPVYFLSIQWVGLPPWLSRLAGLAGMLQFIGVLSVCWVLLRRQDQWKHLFKHGLYKWLLLGFAIFVIKCFFQMLSVFPVIYEMVFHSRNVMIAYLHWHFLGFITLSILILFGKEGWLTSNGNLLHSGLVIFISGFLIQEIYLFTQGVLSRFGIILIELHLEILLLASVLLLTGASIFLLTAIRRLKIFCYQFE